MLVLYKQESDASFIKYCSNSSFFECGTKDTCCTPSSDDGRHSAAKAEKVGVVKFTWSEVASAALRSVPWGSPQRTHISKKPPVSFRRANGFNRLCPETQTLPPCSRSSATFHFFNLKNETGSSELVQQTNLEVNERFLRCRDIIMSSQSWCTSELRGRALLFTTNESKSTKNPYCSYFPEIKSLF